MVFSGVHHCGARRAQSSPIALILVFGLVILGTIAVVVLGAGAIQSSQDHLAAQNAEKAMTQLDSQASLVALGSSRTQRVDLKSAGGDGYRVDETAGTMTVTHTTRNGTETVLDATLGSVTYEADSGSTVAYQGGGVWRTSGDGNAVMVSPPEFHYRDATLTLPLVTVSGDGSVGDRAVISANQSVQTYPNDGRNYSNPLQTGRVTITVQSDYYRAWGTYFEERTDGTVNYDHDSNTARLNLTIPTEQQRVRGAMVSGGTGTTITLKKDAAVDSYNSSQGDYAATGGNDEGDIYAAGGVEMKKDAAITGSLVVGSELTMKKGARVTGDLNYGGPLNLHSSKSTHVAGTVSSGASVPELTAVDGLIDERRNTLDSGNNDNADHSATLTTLETGGACSPCNLTAGQYHLDKVGKFSGTLYLKPGGDTIELVVDGDFVTKNGAEIEVIGDGRVDIYVEGDTELKANTEIINDGDDAPQFWMYMNHDASATLKKNAKYVGVIFGPGTDSSGGVTIDTKATNQIYGALVGNVADVKNGNYIHYDAALTDSTAIDSGTTLPALTYLHISTNDVEVSSG
jgi:hypothetical protein